MKRFLSLLLILTLLLSGCKTVSEDSSSPEPAPPAESESIPESEPLPDSEPDEEPAALKEVEEDVFYYVNELEYNRLYSQRIDGSDLTLVVDAYCYNVKQQGDMVYYILNDALYRYHIPTSTSQLFINNVMEYEVDAYGIAYTQDMAESYIFDLRYHDFEKIPISPLSSW